MLHVIKTGKNHPRNGKMLYLCQVVASYMRANCKQVASRYVRLMYT